MPKFKIKIHFSSEFNLIKIPENTERAETYIIVDLRKQPTKTYVVLRILNAWGTTEVGRRSKAKYRFNIVWGMRDL